jgi:hypothetical protein
MQPQGMTAIALLMAPRLQQLPSLRRLLFLRSQFSTAFCSYWSSRPIGAPLVSLLGSQTRSSLKETAYEFRQ